MEDDESRELEEKVEMEVEWSEATVEHASEVDTYCKLLTKVQTSVGYAESWTVHEPFEWPGPSALATRESLVGLLESTSIPIVWYSGRSRAIRVRHVAKSPS